MTNEGGGNARRLRTDKLPITLALAAQVKDVKDERSGKDLGAGKAFTLAWKLNEAAALSFAGDPPKWRLSGSGFPPAVQRTATTAALESSRCKTWPIKGPSLNRNVLASLFCSRSCRDNGTIPTDNREPSARFDARHRRD